MKFPKNSSPRKSWWSLWRVVLVLVVILGGGRLFFPALAVGGTRAALAGWSATTGLRIQAGAIRMGWGQPLLVEDLQVRTDDPTTSRTAMDVDRVELGFNSLWDVLVRRSSWVGVLTVNGLSGVADFRSGSVGPFPLPFPAEVMKWSGVSLEILSPLGTLYVEDLSATFSERTVGQFRVETARVQSQRAQRDLGSLEGITAWKSGVIYLADLSLVEGVTIENFHIRFAGLGGLAFGMQAAIDEGSFAAEGNFDGQEVDVAMWASGIDVAPIPALAGWSGEAEGILRDARLTFRGDPNRPWDGQASLRISADGFLWNKRGWEALQVGASLIHHRLVLNSFELRQKENTVTGNGEVSVEETWPSMAKAPFLLNVSASIKDLRALSALLGPPFDKLSGRMSLSSSVSGRKGQMDGFLSLEATAMEILGRRFESGRVEVTFAKDEAQVVHCEFWSEKDHLNGRGTVALEAPHAYSGELKMQAGDVGVYRGFLAGGVVSPIQAGAVRLNWEGDGTWSAHSGAFTLGLDDLVSALTPVGLTGTFEGTYSPENIYFRKFDLRRKDWRFTTTATLAGSGIGLKNAVLREKDRVLADAEIFLPMNPFAVFAGTPVVKATVSDQELYVRLAVREPLDVQKFARLWGQDSPVAGTVRGVVQAEGIPSALKILGSLEGRDFSKSGSPDFRKVRGTVTWTGTQARIGPFTGRFASGPFVLQGGADFAGSGAPRYELRFLGRKMNFGRTCAGFPSGPVGLADANLRVTGDAESGTLTGWIRLIDGDILLQGEGWIPGSLVEVWGGLPRFAKGRFALPESWQNEAVYVGERANSLPSSRPGGESPVSLWTIFATPQWHRASRPW